MNLDALKLYPYVPEKQGIDFLKLGNCTPQDWFTESGRLLSELSISSDQIHVRDKGNRGWDSHIMHGIFNQEQRSINFDIHTANFSRDKKTVKSRHPDFFASAFINMFIHYAEDNGNLIESWYALWLQNSTNYNAYTNLVEKENMSPSMAVWETWTGKQATKHGFTKLVGEPMVFSTRLSQARSIKCVFAR